MKNIRIYEDGNRTIIVLEGYGQDAVAALTRTLSTAVNPVDHLKPHTGESEFRLRDTAKQVMEHREPDTPIQKPAFIKKMEQKEEKQKQETQAEPVKPVKQEKPAKPAQPVKNAEDHPAGEAEIPEDKGVQMAAPPNTAAAVAETPAAGPHDAGSFTGMNMPDPPDVQEAEAELPPAPESIPDAQKEEPASAGIPSGDILYRADLLGMRELKQILKDADQKKLAALLKKKGRYPSLRYLLNADARTMREYVKELYA